MQKHNVKAHLKVSLPYNFFNKAIHESFYVSHCIWQRYCLGTFIHTGRGQCTSTELITQKAICGVFRALPHTCHSLWACQNMERHCLHGFVLLPSAGAGPIFPFSAYILLANTMLLLYNPQQVSGSIIRITIQLLHKYVIIKGLDYISFVGRHPESAQGNRRKNRSCTDRQ